MCENGSSDKEETKASYGLEPRIFGWVFGANGGYDTQCPSPFWLKGDGALMGPPPSPLTEGPLIFSSHGIPFTGILKEGAANFRGLSVQDPSSVEEEDTEELLDIPPALPCYHFTAHMGWHREMEICGLSVVSAPEFA
ncbi:hypothetical protein BTVI_152197 [Pitangus sulphuratus]|nr:hypothetical protein BTVI_152197 [Pitangus sulphuratus]